jgi:hypothetical protein
MHDADRARMNPFPPKEELLFLRGLTLSCVVLGPYQIDLVLGDNTIICVEHFLRYVDETGVVRRYDIQNHLDLVTFHPLIREQAEILDIEVEGPLLTLHFPKSRRLIIERNDQPYEAGHITCNDGGVIVF